MRIEGRHYMPVAGGRVGGLDRRLVLSPSEPMVLSNSVLPPRRLPPPLAALPLVRTPLVDYRPVNGINPFVTGWPNFSGLLHYPVKRRCR